jgi:4a-hydroxytetrahydrobiopterin dehydratase
MNCPEGTPARVVHVKRPNLTPAAVTRLKPERVQLMLRKLPQWRLSRDGKSLTRSFKFADPKAPLAFAGFITALAVEDGHYPAVTLNRETVVCKLTTPAAGGVTLKDFEMARRISLQG